jgi:hypothetical protein
VVLKEKPVQSQDGFIPLGALAKNGIPPFAQNAKDGAPTKPEVAEPVAGD